MRVLRLLSLMRTFYSNFNCWNLIAHFSVGSICACQIQHNSHVLGNCVITQTLYPYTTEIYETNYRAKAMGVLSVAGRLGVIFMGMIGVHAIGWLGGNGLYVLFIGFCAVSSLAAAKMPYCTLNKLIN